MKLASTNVNHGRPINAVLADLETIAADKGVRVICVQEVAGPVLLDGWQAFQPAGGPEAILVRSGVTVLGHGSILSTLDKLGQKIRWRRFVWVDVATEDGSVRVVCGHMPPRRMGVLYPIFARRLRRLLSNSPRPWLVAGDWNRRRDEDPARLKADLGATWAGSRIDLWAIHPSLKDMVAGVSEVQDPNRHDDHPVVTIRLHTRPTLQPYTLTTHDGKTVDELTHQALLECERRLGYELTIVQGSYNKGKVGASAGTHDGGGVVDLAPWDWQHKVHVLRAVGWAAWHRPAIPGLWGEHIHAVLIGNVKMSPSAANQVVAYRNGRNGLADNAPDPTWRPNPIPTFVWPT